MKLMRSLLVGTALWMLLAVPATAQTILATLSLDRKEPRPVLFEYVKADEGLVTVAPLSDKSDRVMGLFKYDALLKREWEVKLIERSSSYDVDHISVLGDRIFVFFTEYISREHVVVITYQQYDLTGKPDGPRVELFRSQNERNLRRVIRYERSLDGRQLLCIGRLDRPRGREQDLPKTKFSFALIDSRAKAIKQGEMTLPYYSEDLELTEARFTAKGNIFLLTELYPTRHFYGDSDDIEYTYLLFRFDLNRGRLEALPLNFEGKFITELTCRPDRDENLVVTGFYSNTKKSNIAGVIYGRSEASDTTRRINLRFAALAPEFLARFISPKQVMKGRELSDYYLDNVVLRSDGGLMLMAEKFYTSYTSYRDAFGYWMGNTQYFYNDVLIVSMSPEGNIEWASNLPKEQVGMKQEQLSYVLFVGADKLFFFYRNYNQADGENVYYNTVDEQGNVSAPRPFFQRFRKADIFYRTAARQIDNNTGLLVYYHIGDNTFNVSKVAF